MNTLILPGSDQFWLAAGVEKWVLYRLRYECHAPAHGGSYQLALTLCVRGVSPPSAENCRDKTRYLLLE